MVVIVEVHVEGDARPPASSPILVQVRDTSLADAPAKMVAEARGEVRGLQGNWLETVELVIDELPGDCTVWAHVDVDRSGRVSKGDFVTMQSYPLAAGDEVRSRVAVRRVD